MATAVDAPLTTPFLVRDTVEWREVHLRGDAPGVLVRVERGGTLRWTGGSLERTGGWGSLIHVAGGTLELDGVRLSGAVEHHLLPEPRPAVQDHANEHGASAVLVTSGGTASLTKVEASGRAPALRASEASMNARGCTFRSKETAVVSASVGAELALESCEFQGGVDALSGRACLVGGTLGWARACAGATLELLGTAVTGPVHADGATLTIVGGTGTAAGTVLSILGAGRLHLEDFRITSAGGRGLELQGAATATVRRCRIGGTKLDGIAAFDASTLVVEDTPVHEVGGHPILLAGASDGPAGAHAIEWARPGGPGCDPVELLRARLDAIGPEARPRFVERVAERSGQPALRDWAKSARYMGRAAFDLRAQGPEVRAEGRVLALASVRRGVWVLTSRSLVAVLDGTPRTWKPPQRSAWLAADERGAVVCSPGGLFLPLTETFWPLPLRGPLRTLTLTADTIVLDGGEDSGHPTDRCNWRLVVDRSTGAHGPVEITGQGGFFGTGSTTSVRTPRGEATIYDGRLHWQDRSFVLPGGITTLACAGDDLLAGTTEGAVYRLR